MIRRFTVTITTAADGTATAYSPYFSGYVHTVQYIKTDYADGVDFAITVDGSGETIWAQSDVNASVVKATRTANLERIGLSRDRAKIVISQGGNAKTGTFNITAEVPAVARGVAPG